MCLVVSASHVGRKIVNHVHNRLEVHVVGCLYIMDLINARKMDHIKGGNEQSGPIKCGEFLDLLKTG